MFLLGFLFALYKFFTMILDKIENANLYKHIHSKIDVALKYIQKTNFYELENGKYDVQGTEVYAIVKEYETQEVNNNTVSELEAHKQFIDLHYIIKGGELMGVTTLAGQKPVKLYDESEDYSLYKEPYDLITVNQGMFTIFFPDDLHIPEIKLNNISKVKKVIIKVKL